MKKQLLTSVESAVEKAAHGVEAFETGLAEKARPLRESVFHKFPTLFILLTTFGVTSVLFGFEGIIAQFPFLTERPWLILLMGVVVLGFTGSLYTRLGNQ